MGKTPKFQQRHYEALAKLIQEETARAHTSERRTAVEDVAFAMATMFAADNPRFDRGRFERATVPGANVRARTAAPPRSSLRAAFREGS